MYKFVANVGILMYINSSSIMISPNIKTDIVNNFTFL